MLNATTTAINISFCKFAILMHKQCYAIQIANSLFTLQCASLYLCPLSSLIYSYTYISLLELCYRTKTSFIIELDLKVTFLAKIITHSSKKKIIQRCFYNLTYTDSTGCYHFRNIHVLFEFCLFVDFYSTQTQSK